MANRNRKNKSKPRKAYRIKLDARGADARRIVRLYKARDLKALDAMRYRIKAFPHHCFNSMVVGKPISVDRRSWRETTPKKPSPLRECVEFEEKVEDSRKD